MKIPSPTRKQSVGDRHMISPTRHNMSRSARRRKNTGHWWLSSISWRMKKDIDSYDLTPQTNLSSNSPYYKGLTDQSLAITPTPHEEDYDPDNTASPSLRPLLLSSSPISSPYYKGLTDYSLVVDASWTATPHSIPHHSSSLSCHHDSSPYYRGLIALPISASPSSLYSLNINFNTSTTTSAQSSTRDFVVFLSPEDQSLMVTEPEATLEEGIVLIHPGIQGKPLRVNDQLSSQATLEEMDDDDDDDDDDNSIEGEKPLRVNIESETILEKTILEDAVLLVEENTRKPLREKVTSDSETVLLQQENDDITDLGIEELELVFEQESDVSQGRNEKALINTEKTDLKEELGDFWLGGQKTVSEQTVALEVPCEHMLKHTAEEGNLYEYLWATKYQPKKLGEFICNKARALELRALVKGGCGCNHFIFEGPPNVGKRSMIRAMLREVFGDDGVQVTEEYKDFSLKGEMVESLQLRVQKSFHHVEVNLSEAKGYEKHVIVELFKETYGKVINSSLPCSPENCQAIILYEAEKLSLESVLYIKWMVEKYKGCNKLFFCCSDESRLQPIQSHCTTVRLSSPSTQQIVKILEYIVQEEGIKLSRESIKKIVLRSKNNLRQAIRSLEATYRHKNALNDDDLILTGWEYDILNIAKNVVSEQSPRQLYAIRRKLQSLMIHDVPPDFIYKTLVAHLTSLVDDSLCSEFAKLHKEYTKVSEMKFENKQGGSDEKNSELTKKNAMNYLKVEEFIAKFMSWYRNSSKSNDHMQLVAGV
ncbi:unnamed protein product [Vicia faba]|uniref:Replication factor C subunit 3 n=1 Tax=Vicia faba TaxID=3906 RepID=A0AAV0YDW5_VICFA|nr:unnamed protein product [Vicia faba]